MSRDIRIVFVTACMRSLPISALSVFFGLYLAALGLNETWIGLTVGSGLLGMAAVAEKRSSQRHV